MSNRIHFWKILHKGGHSGYIAHCFHKRLVAVRKSLNFTFWRQWLQGSCIGCKVVLLKNLFYKFVWWKKSYYCSGEQSPESHQVFGNFSTFTMYTMDPDPVMVNVEMFFVFFSSRKVSCLVRILVTSSKVINFCLGSVHFEQNESEIPENRVGIFFKKPSVKTSWQSSISIAQWYFGMKWGKFYLGFYCLAAFYWM